MALTPDEEIDQLVEAGLLTERQATAYVHREIELVPNYAVAEYMGIDDSTVTQYRDAAKRKIDAARATLDALDEIRFQASGQNSY